MYTASLRISVLMLVTLITAEVLGQATEISGAVAVGGVLRLKADAAAIKATTVAPFSFIEADGTKSTEKQIASSEYNTSIPFRVQDTSSPPKTKQILLLVDSIPPRLTDVTASLNTDGTATISVVFQEDDLKANTIKSDAFSLKKTGSETAVPLGTPGLNGSTVTLSTTERVLGAYELTIETTITDHVGNTATAASRSFVIGQESASGEQIEYPQYLAPEFRQDDLNPGDRVDTRVVQLYYFRNARMLAELINRNIQDLNQTAFDDAQKFADIARNAADKATDSRRTQEQRAVDAAAKTRQMEQKIAEAKAALAKNQLETEKLAAEEKETNNAINAVTKGQPTTLDAQIQDLDSKMLTQSQTNQTTRRNIADKQLELEAARKNDAAKVPALEKELERLTKQLQDGEDALTGLKTERSAQRSLQLRSEQIKLNKKRLEVELNLIGDPPSSTEKNQLANQQQNEIDERNRLLTSEQAENRQIEEQFRREVVAGVADRNSYAKGKLTSRDPVTQVSISVVGESRLQLRGPIKGLNKICRMIHQLDSPVGQVKIGIHTVQVNGEHGDRMDVVYERINKEVAHSRFLVNASGQLMRRAVQEVASEVALEADQGVGAVPPVPSVDTQYSPEADSIASDKRKRDQRYLYAFFGADFIGELEELDSELLNTENKLLSLNSMDTISLAGAMFVLAHADHPIRQRIMQRFAELVAGELPLREQQYVKSLTQLTTCGNPLSRNIRKALSTDARIDEEVCFNASRTYHFPNTVNFFQNSIATPGTLSPAQLATVKMAEALKAQMTSELEFQNLSLEWSLLPADNTLAEDFRNDQAAYQKALKDEKAAAANLAETTSELFRTATIVAPGNRTTAVQDKWLDDMSTSELAALALKMYKSGTESGAYTEHTLDAATETRIRVSLATLQNWNSQYTSYSKAAGRRKQTQEGWHASQEKLRSKRLLEQFMDEQEEKSVELMEAIRHHASNVDNYLKRLAIAVEDDVAAQFYEPAFQRIRRVSRSYDVTLGQIETTTILTNNRTLARVLPGASFEFNLPPRQILITEALQGAKALVNEYGNLTQDPTFVGAAQLLKPAAPAGIIGSNAPLSTLPGAPQHGEPGSELEKLIPDLAVYKFETGTGFEIVPVIQPDGNSIVYTFDYMYNSSVREPVRADEKHLGRIKRHYIHTDVQTSSYELREISRYTVALKASRTERGVPLLEDIPLFGGAFRPLPQAESSLQTNIILGSSTIYPTVFDLIGLRWSPYVESMHSSRLNRDKAEQMQRRQTLRNTLLEKTRSDVNNIIGIQEDISARVIFQSE